MGRSVKEIKGLIPPMVTAFTKQGELYEKGIKETIDFLVPHVDGLFVCGTYGGGLMMTMEQRMKAAEIIVDHTAGRVPVIVQVGTIDTASAVKLSKHAESIGADAVASIAPYYYTFTEQELFEYFKAMVDAVKIPAFAYNNPKTSNNPLSAKLISDLAEIGLAGLKDSSFDLVTFYKFKDTIKKQGFKLIVGTEAIMFAALMSGAAGVVAGAANVYPERVKALYKAVESKNYAEAIKLQAEALAIREAIKLGPTVAICHEVLKMRGVDAGYPRAPFLEIDDAMKAKVKKAFEKLNLM